MQVKTKFRSLIKSNFVNHVATLASGTVVAQLLSFAFIPILSRTYPQEAFGILTSYSAMVSLLSSFATLKYDTALVLPKSDRSAYALLKLSNIVGIFIILICCLVLYTPIAYFEEYNGLELYIGIGAVLSVNYNNSALWNIRFKQFKTTSLSKIVQVVGVFLFQIFLYSVFELRGLIIGSLAGILISGIFLLIFRKLDWRIYKSVSFREMKSEAIRYIDFPKYFTLSNVILSLSANLPVLLFVKHITLIQLGIYGMALKIIAQPVSLVSESFRSVILSHMAERKNKSRPILRWYLKMLFFLLICSLIVSGGVIITGETLVELFLGKDWFEVGSYIKMMTPMLISMMIASPGTAAVRVFEMQKYTLKYSIVSLFTKAFLLLVMFYYDVDFLQLLLIYSSFNLVVVIGNNLIIIQKISKYENVIK